jgi:hypothetical protein
MLRHVSSLLRNLWLDESGGSEGARLGLGLGGAAIGFALLGPFGASVGFLAGQTVGNILFPQELPDIDGPRLEGSRNMTASYGDPIRIAYGRVVCGTSLTYYPGFEEHVTTEESGGKGGGPTQTSRSYTYTGDFAVDVCEGPVDSILKIWANKKLIYNAEGTTNPIVDVARLNRAPGANAIRLYLGTETQLPDPTETADKGVAATPAYRGTVRAFFQNYPLDDTSGVPPEILVLVATNATEVLSTTTVDNPGEGDAAWEWQPGLNSWLIMSMSRVDNASQRVITTDSSVNGDQLFPCADRSGNFWSVSRGRSFRKYDGITLKQIGATQTWLDPFDGTGIGDDSLRWEDGIVFGGIRMPDGTMASEKLFFAEQYFGGDQPIVVVDLDNWDQGDFGGVINTYLQLDELEPTLVVDEDGYCWFISQNGGISTLSRVSPGDGSVVETHALDTSYGDITFDRLTNSIICIKALSHMIRWSVDSNSETARLVFTDKFPVTSSGKNLTAYRAGVNQDGRIFIQTGASLGETTEFYVQGVMSQGRSYSMGGDFGLPSSTTHRGFFDESRNAIIKRHDTTGDIFYLYLDRKTGGTITVKEIVDDVSARVGLAASDIVTTNLTDTLHGYLIDRRMPARNALEPLRKFFFFNPVEEDFVVKFPKLGGASVATIPNDDLAAGEGGPRNTVQRLEEDVVQVTELPELLELTYANALGEYLPIVQRAKRPRATTNSRRRRNMTFPGTFLTNEDAARRLETFLYNIWTKRRPISISVSQKWLTLSPADVVDVVEGGVTQEVVLGDVAVGANNVIEMKGAADDPSTLVSAATGEDADTPVQVLEFTAASAIFILDIPLLRDVDDGFGVYVAAGPLNNLAWPGAEVLRSSDGTLYFPLSFVASPREVGHGFAAAALATATDEGVFDRTNTIQITMFNGTLPSSTEALVLDGANALLIGSEVVNYVTSVDDGNGLFTISTLLRGRAGTEGEMGSHVISEKVVSLEDTSLIRKPLDVSDKDVAFFYKGVTRGGALNDGASLRKSVTVLGKSRWHRAAAHTRGTITSDDWTILWDWRAIINGSWKNLVGVPPGIVLDFEVDVLSGPAGTVLATYTSTITANGSVVTDATATFFYDDADQVVDFGAVQTTLTVKIYQVDLVVGRGFPREVTLVGG